MVRKALTVEQKCEKLLEIYRTTKQVYNLTELEKVGAKAGIVQLTIKDVNQQLVADGLVDQDKIGISNFFWSFPSKALVIQQKQIADYQEKIAESKQQLDEANKQIQKLKGEGRAESDTRTANLQRLRALQARRAELQRQRDVLKDNDPEELMRVQGMVEEARQGANRWTDNTWAIQSYIVKKLGKTSKEAAQILELKESFDYV